jgi:hypothetical protein
LWRWHPHPATPKICTYENQRAIEKNWAFFLDGSDLKAIYNINDAKVIATELQDKNDEFYFVDDHTKKSGSSELKNYSIGSQLVDHEGQYYLALHKKIFYKGKRIYLGRLATFRHGDQYQADLLGPLLTHSFTSIFGKKVKHNKNLISCTYISGIEISDKHIFFSYGINDVNFGLAKMDLNTYEP